MILLERRDLDRNRIIATPEVNYKPPVEDIYRLAGTLDGLTALDFQHHEHWHIDYVPVFALGSLGSPSPEALKGIEQLLREHSEKFDIDPDLVSRDERLIKRILSYQNVSGDLYLARFVSSDVQANNLTNGKNQCELYIVNPVDGKPILKKDHIILGDLRVDFQEGNLGYLLKRFQGDLTLQRVGDISIHRKSLEPFDSRGRFGSNHQNDPCIVLREKEFENGAD